ncbi:MAG TPA: hypothetical protein PKD54_05625, partial [Pirellulaceae bacterium]|nr:hypothetical protein [Pirellulaceae bacterium]
GFVISPPREDLPYFAKFPPVHYSGIVPRPYGISPYAAPPGIMPVEMMVPAPTAPAVIKNPFYVPQPKEDAVEVPPTRPASGVNESAQQNGRRLKAKHASTIGTVQRVTNPFYNAELAWVD